MMTFLIYQLKVAVIMAVFYIFYRLFLSKDTWHRLNRVVLLGTALLSFLLPVCIITIHKTQVIPMPAASFMQVATDAPASATPWWHIALIALYAIGLVWGLLRITASILRVRSIIRRARREVLADGTIIYVMEAAVPSFSWMGHIVISEADWKCGNQAIIRHEKAHVALHHSIDVLITDLVTAVQWFNPAIWMLCIDLRAVHEYEADDAVLRAGTDLRSYQYLLISKAAAMNGYTIANNFNHSILKNRIFMMEKETSTRRSLLRALYLLPLVCICLAVNARTKVSYVYDNAESAQTPQKVVGRVVLDYDTLKYEGTLKYENLNPEKEITWEAEAYKLPDGKSVDELIKSLPGVQADDDGNITINGKPVRRILVNGREYFSDAEKPIYANDIVDEVEGKTPEGYSRKIMVNVDENTDQVSITSEDKKDSQFSATAYRLPEGTDINELIKKLPGVEIDDDGNITVNGKSVKRVLVDGKEVSPNEADSISRTFFNRGILRNQIGE
ncbi:MAG: M56 family metallopeptidase [Bacteroidaceae bacterium]|nr:M56 family metallopeptidase [Bacteroidaceae bacterium]